MLRLLLSNINVFCVFCWIISIIENSSSCWNTYFTLLNTGFHLLMPKTSIYNNVYPSYITLLAVANCMLQISKHSDFIITTLSDFLCSFSSQQTSTKTIWNNFNTQQQNASIYRRPQHYIRILYQPRVFLL